MMPGDADGLHRRPPPRPLADAAGAPPTDVPVPWWALLVALAAALPFSILAARGSIFLVIGGGLDPTWMWLAAPDIAHPVITVLLLVLAAACMDRIAPRWGRPLRWTVGMGIAGAVPVWMLLWLLRPGVAGLPGLLGSIIIESACVAFAAAVLGLLLGLASRWHNGLLGRTLMLAVIYDVAVFFICWVAQGYVLDHPRNSLSLFSALLRSGGSCSLRAGFPMGLIVGLALAGPLAASRRRHGVLLPTMPARSSRRRRLLLTCLIGVWVVSLLAGAYGGLTLIGRSRMLDSASLLGNEPGVEWLLDAGVDPNAYVPDKYDLPLHKAASWGHAAIVSLLLAHGAEPDIQDRLAQRPPLHNAARRGRLPAAEALLRGRADPNITNRIDGATPLHKAASRGDLAMVRLLLENGADPNVADRQKLDYRGQSSPTGNTPLHRAAFFGHASVAEALADAGADVGARNSAQQTPLQCVGHGQAADVTAILVGHGAEADDADVDGVGVGGD